MAVRSNVSGFRGATTSADLQEQVARFRPQAAGAAQMATQAAVDAKRQPVRDLTEGRVGKIENDPYNTAALDYLKGVVGGQNVPFTDEVKSAMLAQQGKGTASAEAAQMAALREGMAASGGSIYDPGYQAAQREAMAGRQGANLDAMGKLNTQAGLANFDAQMQGAGQMAGIRQAQMGQANQMALAGAGYRANEFETMPEGPPAAMGGSFSSGGGGGGAAPRRPTQSSSYGLFQPQALQPAQMQQSARKPMAAAGAAPQAAAGGGYVAPKAGHHGYFTNTPATIGERVNAVAGKQVKLPWGMGGLNYRA